MSAHLIDVVAVKPYTSVVFINVKSNGEAGPPSLIGLFASTNSTQSSEEPRIFKVVCFISKFTHNSRLLG
jgi:hypothetical protein